MITVIPISPWFFRKNKGSRTQELQNSLKAAEATLQAEAKRSISAFGEIPGAICGEWCNHGQPELHEVKYNYLNYLYLTIFNHI